MQQSLIDAWYAGVADDMLDFLQEFFDAHPEVSQNEVYVTGESYAGHYVPAVSHRIWKYNQDPFGMPINFKGLAIGALLPRLPCCCGVLFDRRSHIAEADPFSRMPPVVQVWSWFVRPLPTRLTATSARR